MTDTNKVHIQGEIINAPVAESAENYSRYVFMVCTYGKSIHVKVASWGYSDFPARYKIGDKVIVSGSRVTIKADEDGKMKCYPVVRAETIILEH